MDQSHEAGASTSGGGSGGADQASTRGRGGFRQQRLNTIPTNVGHTRTQNFQNVKPVDVMANYVPIVLNQKNEVQMYRVDFEPKVESVELMRFLYRSAAREKFERVPMYDGVHECRSTQKLTDKVTRLQVTDKRASDEDATIYTVSFTHTGATSMGLEMMRTFNIHMKEFFRLLKFFQPQPGVHVHPGHTQNIGDDIMMLRGFRTAADVHDEGKLLMNFEGVHKLIQRRNVCEIMRQIRQRVRGGGDFRETINSELTGKLVVTSYNKRAYRVEQVDFGANPETKFSKKDGSEMSFVDYFKSAYNYEIKDKQQPLLTVIPSNKRRRGDEEKDREIKLIPEMCNIAGLTDEQRNNNKLKMDLIRASQIPPQGRVEHLRAFLKSFHENKAIEKHFEEWGYRYEKEPIKLRAHMIAPTMVGAGPAARESKDKWQRANPETADFNVTGCAVTPCIEKMALIVGRGDLQAKNKIVANLKAGFSKIQLQVKSVEQHDLVEGDQASHFARKIKSLDLSSVTLALVVLHSQNKACYDAVKKAATNEMGMITQVVTARLMTDDRKARSAATKIAIQIAAKIGGEPWWVDIPLRGAMVCGYDTYHDTANRGRSFGAFLASMNETYSRWFSKANQHDRIDEMSGQVAANVIEALNKYQELNGKLPDRIIIYRDGVSEGQIQHVFNIELNSILEKVAIVGKIRLTMIVVNKRVGARFYMRTQDNRFVNPAPGTVIDHSVTRQDRYDFYLISQSTRQGTISPTYYNIIHDESGFAPEIHQKMAYKFCLLYYNWSGSVRVPAPCQYAHKLAFLCGEHLHAQPNALLNDRLHFL